MEKLFIPYHDDAPAALEIKGHRVVIVSPCAEDVRSHLDILGGEEVREISLVDEPKLSDTPDLSDTVVESRALAGLAASVNAGVVLSPPGLDLLTVIRNLEAELPWVH